MQTLDAAFLAAAATCTLAGLFDGMECGTWAPFWLAGVATLFMGAFR